MMTLAVLYENDIIFLWFLLLQIDIYHSDEPLKDFFTLMDIAYIYTWRRVWKSKSVECILRGSRIFFPHISKGIYLFAKGGGGEVYCHEFNFVKLINKFDIFKRGGGVQNFPTPFF